MTHDYHDRLPGYSPAQILHDGCGECEARSKELARGLLHLDPDNFARAWERAAQWQRNGCPDLSHAEMPLLSILWAVQVKLEPRGVPVGVLP